VSCSYHRACTWLFISCTYIACVLSQLAHAMCTLGSSCHHGMRNACQLDCAQWLACLDCIMQRLTPAQVPSLPQDHPLWLLDEIKTV
jgi:hypothetical protein